MRHADTRCRAPAVASSECDSARRGKVPEKGIPGLVTGVPGLPRTARLRIIGNGCVPHQAAAALRLLAGLAAAVPGAPPGTGTGMRAAA